MSTQAKFETSRRGFLRGALATSALLVATRSRAITAAGFNLQRHFAPVKVARDRIIREVVGLRPYRGPKDLRSRQSASAKSFWFITTVMAARVLRSPGEPHRWRWT